jgi:hypothetical protein
MKAHVWIVAGLLGSTLAPAAEKAAAEPAVPPPADKAPVAEKAAQPPAPEDQGPPFSAMDLDKDGGITWNEFLVGQTVAMGKPAAQAPTLPAKDQTRFKKSFKEADQDRSNILTEKEWAGYIEAQLAAKAPPAGAGDKEKELEEKREYYRRMMRRQMR